MRWWTWTETREKAWIWKGGSASERERERDGAGACGGVGVRVEAICTMDENEICFWNMHGQWNKTKGEGERARQQIIQRGAGEGGGCTLSDGSTGFC